ncbi:MAG: nickel-dependent hydrogenase large subunit, partial [Gammaproteobacteria bacterium]|nr:nickel-dependent hydrogenase large subunit [Gammaproteobacteria bacterium]
RSGAGVAGMMPRLFSVCATAQSLAAAQALEQAAGVEIVPAQVRARELLLLAETSREHLLRILLGWSAWLGRAPDAQALSQLGRMRQAWVQVLYPQIDGFNPGGGALQPDRAALLALHEQLGQMLQGLLGLSPADWLELASWSDLQAWMSAGSDSTRGLAQQLCRQMLEEGLQGLGASSVALLPELAADALRDCFRAADAAEFVRAPLWQGQPQETGALQRQQAQPLLVAVRQQQGNGLLSRQLARLCELSQCLLRMAELIEDLQPSEPSREPLQDAGEGLAQVEAARGRLVHWLRMEQGQILDYRILAPTEWNFHPQGPLVQGLKTLPADQRLARLAQLLVDAIDPCVEAQLSISSV